MNIQVVEEFPLKKKQNKKKSVLTIQYAIFKKYLHHLFAINIIVKKINVSKYGCFCHVVLAEC